MENVYIPAFFSSYPNNLNFNEQIESLKSTENFIDWNINQIKKEENIIYESFLDRAIQFMKDIVNDGIKYISDLWKKFIFKLKIIIREIDKIFKRYNDGNNIDMINKNIRVLFGFSNRGRIMTFNDTNKLYLFYKRSLSLICGEVDRQYKMNIELMNTLRDHQSAYDVFSESFIFEKDISYINLSSIYNNTSNIESLERLITININNLRLYEALSSSYNSYSYTYDYIIKNYHIYNKKEISITALTKLYNMMISYHKEDFIEAFPDNIYNQYYKKDNEDKNKLINYISFIILKNNAIIECLKNILINDFTQFKINQS